MLKQEYDDTTHLQSVLQQHTMFCLSEYYDQILQSDKINVSCCNCGAPMKVKYDNLVSAIHCRDCQEVIVTAKSMEALKQRLNAIQNRLMSMKIK